VLVIRREQMEALKQAALRAYETEMVAHLFAFAPPHCQAIGEERVRETIRLGIARASAYRLTNRGPVRFYIELMFGLGSAFDTDPQYPWAGDILRSNDFADQMARADRLHEKAMDHFDKVAGPEGVYALKPLRRLAVSARPPLPFSSENVLSGILQEMTHIYPEKCEHVGYEPLRALIREGIESARANQFSTVRGTALFATLMFTLGHGFAQDPLFPWISRTLKNPHIVDAAVRAKRLDGPAPVSWRGESLGLRHVI
jgi:hypothetical protein